MTIFSLDLPYVGPDIGNNNDIGKMLHLLYSHTCAKVSHSSEALAMPVTNIHEVKWPFLSIESSGFEQIMSLLFLV